MPSEPEDPYNMETDSVDFNAIDDEDLVDVINDPDRAAQFVCNFVSTYSLMLHTTTNTNSGCLRGTH